MPIDDSELTLEPKPTQDVVYCNIPRRIILLVAISYIGDIQQKPRWVEL